jgi:hypothetical protein
VPNFEQNYTYDALLSGVDYTRLWMDYYLKKADPSLNIIILEKIRRV